MNKIDELKQQAEVWERKRLYHIRRNAKCGEWLDRYNEWLQGSYEKLKKCTPGTKGHQKLVDKIAAHKRRIKMTEFSAARFLRWRDEAERQRDNCLLMIKELQNIS